MNIGSAPPNWVKRFFTNTLAKIFTNVCLVAIAFIFVLTANAQMRSPQLHLTYPPLKHETYSNKIFFIGSAPTNGEVTINGAPIARNAAGHFAPSLPLQLGENSFTLKYELKDRDHASASKPSQVIVTKITRLAQGITPPSDLGLIAESLMPKQNIAVQPNERICFEAIATPNTQVSVTIGTRSIALKSAQTEAQLPPNSAVLTGTNQPSIESAIGKYQGCTTFQNPGILGKPEFQVTKENWQQAVSRFYRPIASRLQKSPFLLG
jgi:N-acetylmuramoyl-L-alanine amidase